MANKKYTNERQIYWDIEPHILYDYVNFANRLRPLQMMECSYNKYTMKQDGKRMYLVILTELYQKSLEDLAVILLGLFRRFNKDLSCGYQKKFNVVETPISHTIINYRTKDATIKNIIDKCPTREKFINNLKINSLNSLPVNFVLPYLNVNNFCNEVYENIIAWKGDQEKRFKIYNKIKHGMSVVGSAQILNNKNKNFPAVIYSDEEADLSDHPLIVHCFHFAEDEFILLHNGVIKISDCIRDLIAIYMCKNYPDFLKAKGFSSPLLFFRQRNPKSEFK